VQWDLDPLEMVGQEESSPGGQSPPCRVTNRLRWDLSIGRLKEIHWLDVGVLEVEGLVDGDNADVVVEGWVVPALVELHAGDAPALVSGLQVPVMSPGNDPVKQSQLALTAVGGGDDLVPVDDGAATDVAAERLERDLPGELVFWSLLSTNNPALSKSQVLPKLRLGCHKAQTRQHCQELHVELHTGAELWTGGTFWRKMIFYYLISSSSLTLSFYVNY